MLSLPDGALDRDVAAEISKASQPLDCLHSSVMSQKKIKLTIKIKLYTAVVLTSLLYGCETWTLYRKHIKQLEHFLVLSLRAIMGIKWQDRVTNTEVLDRARLTSIEAMILTALVH